MKIFPTNETSRVSDTRNTGGETSVKKNVKGKKKSAAALAQEKKPVTENEIREKLAAHVATSNTAKAVIKEKNSQKLGSGFMNAEKKPEIKADMKPAATPASAIVNDEHEKEAGPKEDAHLLKTDIHLNDPKDPTTQEKLKSVLSTGAFSFNPRERETLDKILNGN